MSEFLKFFGTEIVGGRVIRRPPMVFERAWAARPDADGIAYDDPVPDEPDVVGSLDSGLAAAESDYAMSLDLGEADIAEADDDGYYGDPRMPWEPKP